MLPSLWLPFPKKKNPTHKTAVKFLFSAQQKNRFEKLFKSFEVYFFFVHISRFIQCFVARKRLLPMRKSGDEAKIEDDREKGIKKVQKCWNIPKIKRFVISEIFQSRHKSSLLCKRLCARREGMLCAVCCASSRSRSFNCKTLISPSTTRLLCGS